MLSKRKRDTGHRGSTAAELLQAYKDRTVVAREGDHTVLRWLVLSQQHADVGDPVCPMDCANATPMLASEHELRDMEQQAAALARDSDTNYIRYAAYFFAWWFRIAKVASFAPLAAAEEDCEWLSVRDLERSLVVPDIRRRAIQLAQLAQIRAGERESRPTGSVSSLLQALRTGEWNDRTHKVLMYGTATDIFHAGLLDVIHLAIVDGRFLGRLNFPWTDNVLGMPARPEHGGAWPRMMVHGDVYLVHWRSERAVCESFHSAFCTWVRICLSVGGVIGGRYDIRKCL